MVSRRVCTVCIPPPVSFPIKKCFCDASSPCSVVSEARCFDALLVGLSPVGNCVIAGSQRMLAPMLLPRLRLHLSGASPLSSIALHPDSRSRPLGLLSSIRQPAFTRH